MWRDDKGTLWRCTRHREEKIASDRLNRIYHPYAEHLREARDGTRNIQSCFCLSAEYCEKVAG